MRPLTPASLDHVVGKCLEKDPEARWHSAHDLHDELAWIATGSTAVKATVVPSGRSRSVRAAIAVLGAVALSVTSWWLGTRWQGKPPAADRLPMRLQVATPSSASVVGFAMSPDGRALAYQAAIGGRAQIWLRPLDSDVARPLDGTDGAFQTAPFWAPDSRSIAFFTFDQLKRVDLDNGLVRTLASAPQPRGGSWSAAGTILFAAGSAGSLNAVPAGGGDPVIVTRVDRPRQTGHRFPHFLPDGRHFLFYALGSPEASGVYVGTLGATEVTRLFEADSTAVFAAPDRVLFARQGALWAQRLDMSALRPVGEPVSVATQVATNSELFGNVALSETAPGLIAYRAAAAIRQFGWFDRTGHQIGSLGGPDDAQPAVPRLSPDGRRLMFRRTLGGNTDLWSLEASRNLLRRLTSHPARDYDAAWAPGGDRIVFTSDRKGVLDIYEASLAGGNASAATLLLETPEHKNVLDWSTDGHFVLYRTQATGSDIWALPMTGERTPVLVTRSADRARFSPDVQWVAYESTETGRTEVYVQSFPDATGKTQISTAGGMAPLWRGDGGELFLRSLDDRLMAARIRASGTELHTETPSVLFALPSGPNRAGSSAAWYDVSRDGQRFLVNTYVEGSSSVTVLLNWKPGN